MAKDYVKLKSDFFNDKAIKKMRSMAGGNTYAIIYLKLLLLSAEHDNKVYYDFLENSFEKELALELDENVDDIKITLSFLENVGLIEYINEYEIRVFKVQNLRNRTAEEYKEWRSKVYERDNYTCQKCKQRGGKLNAHHIKEWALYPKERYVVSNGITYCEDCHRIIHNGGENNG